MPRDYAKVKSNYTRPRRPKKSSREGRLWILTIVITGLFVLGLVYLKKESERRGHSDTELSKAIPTPTSKPALPQPHFDFDTPSAQKRGSSDDAEQVDTDSKKSPNQMTQDSAATLQAAKNSNSYVDSARAEVAALAKQQLDEQSEAAKSADDTSSQPISYIVQFGVFRHFVEADALKAELVLQGLEIKINPFIKEGVTWYRVWAGPFKTQKDAEQKRQNFADNQLKSEVIEEQ